ncbi:MAG: glycosyltransferase family 4 protein, partial [Candidatus Paceibacterota bacterium]
EYYAFDGSNQESQKLIIGNVSRIHPAKCLEDFIKIAKLISKEITAEFWIIGNIQDEKYYERLKALIIEENLGDVVKFLGHVVKADLIYSKLDLMIHTADAEPFGMVYYEAALAKVPVIANRPGGFEDIAINGEDLLFYQFGDVSEAAKLAVELLNNKDLQAKLTDNFYSKVISQHSALCYQQNLEQIYLELLAK